MKNAPKPSKALLKQIEEQGHELAYLQRKCKEHGIPILIIVEGLSAAGKGTLINRIIQPLDPRGFKVSCIASPSRDEQLRPFLWRFGVVLQAPAESRSLTAVGTATCSMPISITG